MNALREFFCMGGYAFFVWGSYALVALALLWGYAAPARAEKKILRALQKSARDANRA